MALTPESLAERTEQNIRSGLPGGGLTADDGRDYAKRQMEGRDADEPSTRAPAADAPTSVKLEDVIERNVTTFNADDLAVLNASVVELQAYESSLVAPPVGLPVIIDVPYVSQDADTLFCTMGNWQNEPSSYAYQWQMDGVDVPNPSESQYTVLPGVVGQTATCVVTATNDAGSTVAPTSNAVVVADPTPAAREA